MVCDVCGGRIVAGQRVTFLGMTNRSGSPAGEYVMHEACKDEMVKANPLLAGVPNVDLVRLC